MSIDKSTANKVLTNLDRTAGTLQALAKSGKVDARLATQLVHELDAFADKFQIAAYGEEKFRSFQAKVLKKDPDEKFMDTFDGPSKVIEKDADEPYMDDFNTDRSTTVTERDEYQVKGDPDSLKYSDPTKKQPSWKGAPKSHKASSGKTWAP